MGLVASLISQNYLVSKPTWSVNEVPDLSGKVVIITGGNTGAY